jgi:hypothetical protein
MELLLKILASSSINDVEKICKKFGVNIKNNDGNYKTIDIVFNELSMIYGKLKK